VQLAKGTKLTDIPGTVQFKSPGGNTLNSTFLKPVPITKDNLNVVIDAGWISKDEVCQGVAAGKVAVCK
jgi:D-xylose transport system substrate-binding protein